MTALSYIPFYYRYLKDSWFAILIRSVTNRGRKRPPWGKTGEFFISARFLYSERF